ncbi:MAG: GNAT family N-acetyltransferase [Oscillospiraceae bacterium]|nr:GNAT family N-acetyltransferase [Oscillospiraceae bacterium]
MTTKLYLIRHAEAEGNLYRRIHGHYDSPITDLGMKQIAALGERFDGLKIDAVYASDLVRAQTTARALSVPRNLEIRLRPDIREVSMGRWEDETWASVERIEPNQLAAFSTDPARWDLNGTNESFAGLTNRIGVAITEIAATHPGQTVAIVTHGNAIRALLARLHGLSSIRFSEIPHCDNTAVALLEAGDGGLTVRWMNDASHLDETLSTFARQSWWRSTTGGDKGNLDFLPLNLDDPESHSRYLTYRQDAWGEVHGTLAGFTDEYVARAAFHAAAHDRALVEAVTGDGVPVGLLELDIFRGEETGEGHISFFYIKPEFRGRYFGPQLIGHAVSVYRPMGRDKLTLHVSEVNEKAIGFYERFGFEKTGQTEGVRAPLWVMEKDITVRVR